MFSRVFHSTSCHTFIIRNESGVKMEERLFHLPPLSPPSSQKIKKSCVPTAWHNSECISRNMDIKKIFYSVILESVVFYLV